MMTGTASIDPVEAHFIDIRQPHTNKLLFRFDPIRDLIEIQVRGILTIVDLTQHRLKMAE